MPWLPSKKKLFYGKNKGTKLLLSCRAIIKELQRLHCSQVMAASPLLGMWLRRISWQEPPILPNPILSYSPSRSTWFLMPLFSLP